MKHEIVHALQKYVLNPPIKLLFALGVAPPGYALLETVGRKTGKPRRTPVGDGQVGYQFWVVAEHGMKAGYVRNIAANPRVRLKLRHGILARWRTGTAQVLPDDGLRRNYMISKIALRVCHRLPRVIPVIALRTVEGDQRGCKGHGASSRFPRKCESPGIPPECGL